MGGHTDCISGFWLGIDGWMDGRMELIQGEICPSNKHARLNCRFLVAADLLCLTFVSRLKVRCIFGFSGTVGCCISNTPIRMLHTLYICMCV